jgi:L-ascorbate metabolism protein UlaG (beta-lactamase superfamily)
VLTAMLAGLGLAAFAGPIHDAVRAGDLARVKALVAGSPKVVNEKDARGRTPLHIASQAARCEIADFLLDSGADVNAADDLGQMPLHLAAAAGQMETVDLLLAKGADPKAVSRDGRTLMHRAAAGGLLNLMERLRERTPLDLAREYSYPALATELERAGAEPAQDAAASSVAALLARPLQNGDAIVWSLGHCGFAVKTRTHLLIFDYLGRGPAPERPSLANGFVNPEEIKDQNVVVFVSHDHPDHFDREILSWRSAVKNITYVFGWRTNPGDRTIELPAPRAAKTLGGMEIYTINEEHDDVPEVSYLVKVDGLSLFHSGDYIRPLDTYESDMDHVLGKAGRIDIAFLSRVFHAKSLAPRVVFPIHAWDREYMYGAFAREAAQEKVLSRVICPENRGDRFALLR